MPRYVVTVQETKVGGKRVHRGEIVEPSPRELAAAPFAFAPVEEPGQKEEPAPPPLFQQLLEDDRENAARVADNQVARRQGAARQHVAQARMFLGLGAGPDPFDVCRRLAEAAEWEPGADGPDFVSFAGKAVDSLPRALDRAREEVERLRRLLDSATAPGPTGASPASPEMPPKTKGRKE